MGLKLPAIQGFRVIKLPHILDGPFPEALAALRMSIYTAPSRPWLIFWRLEMAAYNGDFWDEQMIDLVSRQILLAWSKSPVMLVQTAVAYGLVPITREVLSSNPEQLSQFETLLQNKNHLDKKHHLAQTFLARTV